MSDSTNGAGAGDTPAAPHEDVPFRKFLLYFLRLGTTGFGGPIATVGYVQRDLVEQRAWIGRQDFLDGVALGQAMPGPLAAQVAMWIGYLQRGSWGALAVAGAFIGPALLMVIAAGPAAALGTGGQPRCCRWACSSFRPAPWSSARAWRSWRCCVKASWTSTTGSTRPSSSMPSRWD